MARPRPFDETELKPPDVRPVSQPSNPEPDPETREREARALLGQIAILAVPLDTYRKIEQEAQKRGMRTAELLQRALVEYIEQHPVEVKE